MVGRIGEIHFRQSVSLAPAETKQVALDPAVVPELALPTSAAVVAQRIRRATALPLQLAVEQAGVVSDDPAGRLRDPPDGAPRLIGGVLFLKVNGCRILCRGGNWGMDEGMLDCDAAGYDLRVRLHRDMNLVMIRNWVGMVGRQAFYDACDRYGLLVWDDFWLANPADGPPPSNPGLFLANAFATRSGAFAAIRRSRSTAAATKVRLRRRSMPACAPRSRNSTARAFISRSPPPASSPATARTKCAIPNGILPIAAGPSTASWASCACRRWRACAPCCRPTDSGRSTTCGRCTITRPRGCRFTRAGSRSATDRPPASRTIAARPRW